MPDTITRSKYNALKRHDYAGPKSSLLPETQEWWPASHWAMRARSNGGTELAPVNIIND